MCKKLIYVENSRIENDKDVFIKNLSWTMNEGEVWLIIGPNGGGKADFVKALSNAEKVRFVPSLQSESFYSNYFGDSVETVSLERAARLIQEERENDESEYYELSLFTKNKLPPQLHLSLNTIGCIIISSSNL